MSDRDNDNRAVDPPDDQPGGDDAMRLEPPPSDSDAAVDPPDDQPGGEKNG